MLRIGDIDGSKREPEYSRISESRQSGYVAGWLVHANADLNESHPKEFDLQKLDLQKLDLQKFNLEKFNLEKFNLEKFNLEKLNLEKFKPG